MLGGLCGLTSWLLRIPLADEAPGTLWCLKTRPAGELSLEECGEATVEGEREVDSERDPLLKVPVPVPVPGPEPRGICPVREDGCDDAGAAGEDPRCSRTGHRGVWK
jgi:hypothetical protein